MLFRKKSLTTYEVDLYLNGRHPYLKDASLDYPSRELTVIVAAKDWNHAESVALYIRGLPDSWSRRVTGIRKVKYE